MGAADAEREAMRSVESSLEQKQRDMVQLRRDAANLRAAFNETMRVSGANLEQQAAKHEAELAQNAVEREKLIAEHATENAKIAALLLGATEQEALLVDALRGLLQGGNAGN